MRQVRDNADSIATASSEIAAGNGDLSARAESQASALQETAASMETAHLDRAAKRRQCRRADELARAASTWRCGGEVVHEVVGTMGSWAVVAQDVDIISVIPMALPFKPTSWR